MALHSRVAFPGLFGPGATGVTLKALASPPGHA